MEQHPSTNKFNPMNFNLKKIIFSFLKLEDQRKIYWSNKQLRKLLPDSALDININSFKKRSTYNTFSERVLGMLELTDERIFCRTQKGIIILKIQNQSLELDSSLLDGFPIWTKYKINDSICYHDYKILYTDTDSELILWDTNLNFISKFKEIELDKSLDISALCSISQSTFAVAQSHGKLKIFQKHEEHEEHGYSSNSSYYSQNIPVCGRVSIMNHHSYGSNDYLLFNNCSNLITLDPDWYSICAYNLTTKNLIRLREHKVFVSSIISLDEKTFASADTNGGVKIWEFEDYDTIKCTNTMYVSGINGYSGSPVLTLLSKDYLVIHLKGDEFLRFNNEEFQVWNWKTSELLKTYKNDFRIRRLIVLKNNSIIITSEFQRVSLWRISE